MQQTLSLCVRTSSAVIFCLLSSVAGADDIIPRDKKATATKQNTKPTRIAATESKLNPDDCRLIVNWDEINLWLRQVKWAQAQQPEKMEPEAVKALIEEIVDEHAHAKVDRLVHCLFSLPWGTTPANFKSFSRAPNHGWMTVSPQVAPAMNGFDAKYDLTQVMLDRSRKNGMQFLVGLRMNDRHPNTANQPFYRDHPDWRLEGFPGGMDYKHEGVRKTMLAVIEEFLDRYDVDGIELDWMRHCHVFKPSEAKQNAHLLTEFVSQTRKILDKAAKRRGRKKLLLGMRIPQTLKECHMLGFDVKNWTQLGRVDYLCPSDFHFFDTNIRVEDFVKLTRGTNCQVFPTVVAALGIGNNRRGLKDENFRAAANNYYAFGARGVSAYNFYNQYRILPGNEWAKASPKFMLAEWPRALGYLTRLRDPKAVARGDRHYLYHPLWPGNCPTGARKSDLIELARNESHPSGSQRLRMAENLESPHLSATLEFKVTGLVEGDELELALNGKAVPAESIRRKLDVNGQSKEEGRVLSAFYLYQITLTSPLAKSGDNKLTVRLIKNVGKENPRVQEFEILVRDSRP